MVRVIRYSPSGEPIVEERAERTDEGLADYMINFLAMLRDDYSDRVPEELVHSTSPDNKYKCRTAWFACVRGSLEKLKARGLLPEEIARKYKSFEQAYQYNMQKSRLTNPEDIEAANSLINETISSLEARLGRS